MGFRFRKSFGLGPFRINVGKRGLSTSLGIRGLRLTSRADGRKQVTVGVPGTGLSYVQPLPSDGREETVPDSRWKHGWRGVLRAVGITLLIFLVIGVLAALLSP